MCLWICRRIEAIIDEGGGRLSGAAMLQGLFLYQEDHILYMFDIVLPPFGKSNLLFKSELEVTMIIEGLMNITE